MPDKQYYENEEQPQRALLAGIDTGEFDPEASMASVTAAAVPAVAVAASAGLVRFPQGPDSQCCNSNQHSNYNDISHDSGHGQSLSTPI